MTTITTIAISSLALAVSIVALYGTWWRDKRDMMLRFHEHLTTVDQQRGRRVLYKMYESGRAVKDLKPEEYDLANNALASLNTLGIYYRRRYLRHGDLLEIWAETLLRLLAPADGFLVHRDALKGGRSTWPQLEILAAAARVWLRKHGKDPEAIEASVRRATAPGTESPGNG
jgi:hypothetical protein